MDSVRAVVCDFDGVFTDNGIYIDDYGKETIRCDMRDTYCLRDLQKKNIATTIISGRNDSLIKKRCKKMEVELFIPKKRTNNKFQTLLLWIDKENLLLGKDKIIYLGNDLNDLECMKCDDILSIAVADAAIEILKISDYILESKGGYGAVRELYNLITY